jgi:hypothetical protein
MEILPTNRRIGLSFSQGSLQDFVDCRWLYRLRHLIHLAWPALESEPVLEVERLLRQGARFHRLVHQWILGIDPARLVESIDDVDLQRWWDHLTRAIETSSLVFLKDASARLYPEVSLVAYLSGYRVIAKFDLIAVMPSGKVIIYDWKTSRKKPGRMKLAGRLQTRVYPYLLVRAGSHLNGGSGIQPDQVQMIYWFSDFPDTPEIFDYSEKHHLDNQEFIGSLIDEIVNLKEDDFYKTSRLERCEYCVYRSLCERGANAGYLNNVVDEADLLEPDLNLVDFDLIPEILL